MSRAAGLLLFVLSGCIAPTDREAARHHTPQIAGETLLQNGDFDSAEGWTWGVHRLADDGSEPATLTVVDAGSATDPAAEIAFSEWSVVRLTQRVNVKTGDLVRFEGLVRTTPDFKGTLHFVVANQAGLAMNTKTRTAFISNGRTVKVPLSPDWKRFQFDVTVGDEYKNRLVIQVLSQGAGKVWLDELQLRAVK